MIEDGKTAREIAKALSVSIYTLKEHLLLLQRMDKKYYEIPGLLADQAAAARVIRRRRGLVYSPLGLARREFRAADAFEMIERDGRVILKKIT
jgi:hypothetical protein